MSRIFTSALSLLLVLALGTFAMADNAAKEAKAKVRDLAKNAQTVKLSDKALDGACAHTIGFVHQIGGYVQVGLAGRIVELCLAEAEEAHDAFVLCLLLAAFRLLAFAFLLILDFH